MAHTDQASQIRHRLPDRSIALSSSLAERLRSRRAHVVVLGLGYAGLPMATVLARAGFSVSGVDVDEERVRAVNQGRSPVSDVADGDIADLVRQARLRATTSFSVLREADCVLICVPTPLTPEREPDLRFVRSAVAAIAANAHSELLVILQSTCAPGTTRREVVQPIEERGGLRVGRDFFVAFAPERIDPGNREFTIENTPKLVGGATPACTELAQLLYESIVEPVIAVSSPEVAELAKLIENSFRFINISFVNEMAVLCDRLGVSVWEAMDAAATKPFAFMPHYPGPGVGGHCIPIVPFYLEAAAREHGMVAELIQVSGRINDEMPRFVVSKLARILAERKMALKAARVLLLGVAYKADVSDTRETPALRVFELLQAEGASVAYYDPYVPTLAVNGVVANSLSTEEMMRGEFDCAVLLTPHSSIDYASIARRVGVFFDTRNRLRAVEGAFVVQL